MGLEPLTVQEAEELLATMRTSSHLTFGQCRRTSEVSNLHIRLPQQSQTETPQSEIRPAATGTRLSQDCQCPHI